MKKRVITAIVLLCVLAVVVWQIHTPLLAFVVAFLSASASYEIMKCAKVENIFIRAVGTAFSAGVVLFSGDAVMEPWISSETWGRIVGLIPGTAYVIVLCLVFLLAMLKDYAYTSFEDVAVAVFAGVPVAYVFSILVRLRDMFENDQFGIYLIFYALICALATDSGAQLTGMAVGKHKMSPNISPKKTVEGAVGGLIFSMLLNGIALTLYNKFAIVPLERESAAIFMIACVPVSFLGMMGDLSASVLKRNFNIKDFGKIFPGHGGVMDRFDSSLFTLSVTYVIAISLF